MARDPLPGKDLELKAFLDNLSTLVSATPTAYGVTASIATELASRVSAFDAALAAAITPATRGNATVLAKDEARDFVKDYAREVIKQIQGTITVTNAQRQALGITIPKQREPIPVPEVSPAVDVKSVIGRIVTLRIHDADSETKRGRPPGVAYASIYSFVGASAPADPTAWKFEGITTRTKAKLIFPADVPNGSQVWITASWSNPRGQAGPGCEPVGFILQGGSGIVAA